jgi:Amiloride-sensitive sodium channel
MALCPSQWMNVSRALETGLSLDAIRAALLHFDFEYGFDDFEAAQRNLSEFMAAHGHYSVVDMFKTWMIHFEDRLRCDRCVNNGSVEVVQSGDYLCFKIDLIPENAAMRNVENSYVSVWYDHEDHSYGVAGRPAYLSLNIQHDWISPMYETGLYLDTRKQHWITIKPTRILQQESGDCFADRLADKVNYSEFMCMSDCMQRQWYLPCFGCMYDGYFVRTPERENWTYCTLRMLEPECRLSQWEAAETCNERCPARCETLGYALTMSSGPLETEDAPEHRVIRKFTAEPDDQPARTVVLVLLDVTDGVVTFEEVSVYTFDTLVANLGGVLGFCFGGSIITFVQVFLFFADRVGVWGRLPGAATGSCPECQQLAAALAADVARQRVEIEAINKALQERSRYHTGYWTLANDLQPVAGRTIET